MIASTATITLLLVAALLAIAATMVVLAVWLIRTTRTDPPALGPLEVMGDRSWRRADGDRRTETLAGVRPPGSSLPAPMVPLEEEPAADADGDGPVTETPEAKPAPDGEATPEPHGEAEPGDVDEPEPKLPSGDEPTPPPAEPTTPALRPDGERDPDAAAPSTPA